MSKMPTVMWEVGATERLRIIPHLPLYQFFSYGQNWYRILMMEDGYCLRMQLTPLNPTAESEWEALRDERITWCGRGVFRDTLANDKITRTLPAEVVRHMHHHLGSPLANRLLTGDIWAEIGLIWPLGYKHSSDVSNWLGRCGYNGGIALDKIQKNPPTHEQLYAAVQQKRDEERRSRIDLAVGTAEPLSDAEWKLGESLESHDWSYSYSDCGNTWRRGQAHREELEKSLRTLPVERARLVWTAFVHKDNEQYWKCPV